MANDINTVSLTGRLTKDAELKTFNGGSCNCRFSIAVNRRAKSGDTWIDEAHYFDCVLWGKQAEALRPYLTKGRQVGISGDLRQNRWEKDGQKYSKVEIYPDKVVLLSGGGDGNSSTNNNAGPASAPSNAAPVSQEAVDEIMNQFDGSDIPF